MLVVFQRGPIQNDLAGLAASYLDGVQAAADDFKLRVVLATIGTGERIAEMSLEIVRSEPVGVLGALLMGLKDSLEPVIAQLQELKIPMVAVNRYWPDSTLSFVGVDYVRAQMDAVQYLVHMGHRTIAYVGMSRDEGHSWFEQRRQGYLAALDSAEQPLVPHPISASDAAQAIDMLLEQVPDVTAVCAANDTIALTLIQELKRRSIAIPKDISVIGFDDDTFNPPSDPPLSTVGYSTYEIGYWATRVLVEQASKSELARMQITMQTHLVERESCDRRR
jgi:DNA-binding LacI/PurR family transcriptional regulator